MPQNDFLKVAIAAGLLVYSLTCRASIDSDVDEIARLAKVHELVEMGMSEAREAIARSDLSEDVRECVLDNFTAKDVETAAKQSYRQLFADDAIRQRVLDFMHSEVWRGMVDSSFTDSTKAYVDGLSKAERKYLTDFRKSPAGKALFSFSERLQQAQVELSAKVKETCLGPPPSASAGRPSTTAGQSQGHAIPEYCGKTAAGEFGNEFLQWDCTGLEFSSFEALRADVEKTHEVETNDDTFQVLVSKKAVPFSGWIIIESGAAVRYRAIYDGANWKSIGVTTFCSRSAEKCAHFEAYAAKQVPSQLMPRLLPPPPETPKIHR